MVEGSSGIDLFLHQEVGLTRRYEMNWSARYANNQVSNAGSEEDALQILGYLKTCFGLLRGFTYLQKDTSQSMTSEWVGLCYSGQVGMPTYGIVELGPFWSSNGSKMAYLRAQ